MDKLTVEQERDVFIDALDACARSFENLARLALDKAALIRDVIYDPQKHSEDIAPRSESDG